MAKTAITKEQDRLLSLMSKPLQKVALALQEKDGVAAVGMIRIYHRQGQLIQKAMDNEAKYGEKAVEKLAAYRGVNPSDIYALQSFAATWPTLEELEVELKDLMANGRPLTYKHFRVAARIESVEDRTKFLRKCRIEAWSANQTEKEYAAKDKTQRKNIRTGSGRNVTLPSSAPVGMQQIYKQAATQNKRWPGWYQAVFDHLDKAPQDKFTPTLLEDMGKVEEELQEEVKNCREGLKRISALKARLQKIEATASENGAAEPKAKSTKKPGKKVLKKKPQADSTSAPVKKKKKKTKKTRKTLVEQA